MELLSCLSLTTIKYIVAVCQNPTGTSGLMRCIVSIQARLHGGVCEKVTARYPSLKMVDDSPGHKQLLDRCLLVPISKLISLHCCSVWGHSFMGMIHASTYMTQISKLEVAYRASRPPSWEKGIWQLPSHIRHRGGFNELMLGLAI